MALILAFDLGTGGNKASVFDSSGRYVASEFVEYPTTYPCVGWHEQAPEDWYQAVVTSTRKLLAHPEIDPREISCLAISGHSLGCVPLDSQGNLLRRTTPIWSDVRAVEEAALFFEKEDPGRWYQKTGNGFSAAHYTIFKILWYARHEPEMFRKTRYIIGTKDYINYRLTGKIATDPGYASGYGVWNLRHWCYDEELIAAAGIDGSLLPEVIASTDIVGTLHKKAAEDLGISEKVVVVCGSVDNSCMALGAGNIKRGRIYASLGSSSWIALSDDHLVLDDETRPYVFAHVIPGYYTIALALFSSGTTFRWLRDVVCRDLVTESERSGRNVYELMIEEAESSPPGANGVIMNPNFSGGATHDGCPEMRGGFLNLDLSHTRGDLIRSTMEGIALGMRNVLEGLEKHTVCDNRLTVVGGGSISKFWRQIYADVMNRTLVKTNVDLNAASLGAATLAAIGTGLWSSFDRIDEILVQGDETFPNPENLVFYDKIYTDFMRMYKHCIQYARKS